MHINGSHSLPLVNTTVETITGKAGDTICRPAVWTDVVKFFLVNYGLHAITVITEPGDTVWASITAVALAILLPFSGIHRALKPIYRFPERGSDALQIARKAGALCTFVPDSVTIPRRFRVTRRKTNVHGQGPSRDLPGYQLARVPNWFTVKPLIPNNGSVTPISLSSNYSLIKAVAAILQVLYGSTELYQAQGHQFVRFGYAAYSLTVIPYILMSLTNMLASACAPQYPSVFIVLYRGETESIPSAKNTDGDSKAVVTQRELEINESGRAEDAGVHRAESTKPPRGEDPELRLDGLSVDRQNGIVGAIGEAYGDFDKHGPESDELYKLWMFVACLAAVLTIAAPYVVMKILTNFEPGQSSRSQRAWVLSWIVLGQVFGSFGRWIEEVCWEPKGRFGKGRFKDVAVKTVICTILVTVLPISVATIGGLVVVARMILDDEICTRL